MCSYHKSIHDPKMQEFYNVDFIEFIIIFIYKFPNFLFFLQLKIKLWLLHSHQCSFFSFLNDFADSSTGTFLLSSSILMPSFEFQDENLAPRHFIGYNNFIRFLITKHAPTLNFLYSSKQSGDPLDPTRTQRISFIVLRHLPLSADSGNNSSS